MLNKNIIVGLSGGVDSSVSALLLLEQGYNVSGLFMKNWEEDDTSEYCSAKDDLNDAQEICNKLGIKLYTVNFAAEYWEQVFTHFLAEYKAGRTPNPDILCNKEIKFKVFLDYAKQLGANAIATGHYAAIQQSATAYNLLKPYDKDKDQTYFLYSIGQNALSQTLFPLCNLSKKDVRGIAKKANFLIHKKKDSTGICFIGERRFKHFLQSYLPAKPGNIITTTGKKIGRHDGTMYYTIGQRRGLQIGGLKNYNESPWYVVSKDINNNNIIVSQDIKQLYATALIASDIHWIINPPSKEMVVTAKIRYRQLEQACYINYLEDNNMCHVTFKNPQRAISPGQAIVFYNDNYCLGGGTIQQAM